MAQASHQPGHIVPQPKHRKSLTKKDPFCLLLLPRNLVFHFESSKPGPSLQVYTSLSERRGSIEYRSHLNVQQILFGIYICAEVASAFHDFFLLLFLLVLICPVLVVALLILLGHRTVNRDPCILYSRVGARRCVKRGFIKSRTGGSPITCVVSLDKLF